MYEVGLWNVCELYPGLSIFDPLEKLLEFFMAALNYYI